MGQALETIEWYTNGMFFGAFTAKPLKTPSIIFDIGGTSVGGAFALLSPGEKPLIAHAAREWLRPMEEVSMERLLGLLEGAMGAVADNLLSIGRKRIFAAGYYGDLPSTVHCFLTAPWCASRADTIRISGARPFKVTDALLERAIEREKKAIVDQIGATDATKKGKAPLAIMESRVLSLSVNGYETAAVHGQSAEDIEFSLYTALAEQAVLDRFSARAARSFGIDSAEHHSFLFAFLSAVRGFKEAHEDFLLLDVSGEVTEISVVRGSRLLTSASYPLGRNFLIRTIREKCGVSPEEALSIIALHAGRQGNDAFSLRFTPALAHLEAQWMRGFENALTRLVGEAFLPHTVFIAADSAIAPWVAAALEKEALYQYTLAAKPFVANLADEKMLDAYVAFGPGVEKDPFLSLDALCLTTLL